MFFSKLREDLQKGDSIWDIIYYWFPEVINYAILVTLPPIIDSYIVASSQAPVAYGALGMTSNFINILVRLSEGIPVAAIAIIGRYNGSKEYKQCGEAMGDVFWTTFILGLTQFLIIAFLASGIFQWLGVPPQMAAIGAPFLRIKSLGLFLTFILVGFIGFMRAVKNTRVPMVITVIGMLTFIFFDYSLVLGKFGLPQCNLNGSGIASIIQFTIMNIIALSYILLNPDYKKYFQRLFFSAFKVKRALQLLNLSWPIIIDKGALAWAYVWLSKMIAPMGTYAITTFDVVKNLERFAFIPAAAVAQVITFLVSNRIGAQDLEGANSSIKKALFFTAATVIPSLVILCLNASYFISFFDPTNSFTPFAAKILSAVSLLVIFDFTQVVLAGALRGAGDVRTVMLGRTLSVFLFFAPLAYIISLLPIQSQTLKFTLIYSTYYLNTGMMGLVFLWRMKTHKWQKIKF